MYITSSCIKTHVYIYFHQYIQFILISIYIYLFIFIVVVYIYIYIYINMHMYIWYPRGLPLMSFPWHLRCFMIIFWVLILNYYCFLMFCVAFDEKGLPYTYIYMYIYVCLYIYICMSI